MEWTEARLLDALAYLECVFGVLSYVALLQLGSPYGRYSAQRPGPRVPARAAWALQELPSLAWPLCECVRASAARLVFWPNRILLAMFLVHYAQRTLVFPFLIRGGKPTPLFSVALAFVFCTYNGYLQSRYLSRVAVYDEDWVTHPCFLAGVFVWLVGLVINIHSDHILRNLRKPGETGYRIPRGGLFEYVSAAILGRLWSGAALRWPAGPSRPGRSRCLLSAICSPERSNITSGTMRNVKITHTQFRKILIPFLY